MKRWLALTAVGCLILGVGGTALAAKGAGAGADDGPGLQPDDNRGRGQGPKPQLTRTVLEVQTMVGVDEPFLGTPNPIRGVNGGGLPWVLEGAKGELKDDGKLEVEVQGLVIPAAFAPPACAGVACNPVPFFRAVLSCLTVDPLTGTVVETNRITTNGAAVMIGDPHDGNAKIEAVIDLPDPCLAPILFVTSPTGAWFAVSGLGTLAAGTD